MLGRLSEDQKAKIQEIRSRISKAPDSTLASVIVKLTGHFLGIALYDSHMFVKSKYSGVDILKQIEVYLNESEKK